MIDGLPLQVPESLYIVLGQLASQVLEGMNTRPLLQALQDVFKLPVQF